MQGRVQECGCIAIPEDLVARTGLGPGTAYELDLSADGKGIVIVPANSVAGEFAEPARPVSGTSCG